MSPDGPYRGFERLQLDSVRPPRYFRAVSNEGSSRSTEHVSVRGQVLTSLRDSGPLPRIALARELGVSPTTITRVVAQLVEEGVVAEGSSVSPAGFGRPATEVSIKADASIMVGVQIGVGFVQLGLVDLMGTVLHTTGFEYPVEEEAPDVLDRVGAAVLEIVDAGVADKGVIDGIGIAVPGPVDRAGRRTLLTINLAWRDVAVADQLERLTGLPVTVDHNVRSMAVAEVRFGGGRNSASAAFVYLRTGLGAGLVVEGQPFAGGVHGAIEVGHLQLVDNGVDCVCGGRGCIETVVSESALRRALERVGSDDDRVPLSALWHAAHDSAAAKQELDGVMAPLALGVASIANLLNPEVIFLGGALTQAPSGLFDRLRDDIERGIFPLLRGSIRIERSSLGFNAGVLGAATVALDRFFYS